MTELIQEPNIILHRTIRKNGTRRVITELQGPSKTDQSFKKACDINLIMAAYQKTGVLPSGNTKQPRYVDNTNLPTLESAFDQANSAIDLFNTIPAQLRKLMDNDPRNLESFIQDPQNADLLIKHGLLEPTPSKSPEAGGQQKPPQASSDIHESKKDSRKSEKTE